MAFSMPLHEFSRLKLTAKVTDSGTFGLSFQSVEQPLSSVSKNVSSSDASIHFENSFENGIPILSVYVSSSDKPNIEKTVETPESSVGGLLNNDNSEGAIDQSCFMWPDFPNANTTFQNGPVPMQSAHDVTSPPDQVLNYGTAVGQNLYDHSTIYDFQNGEMSAHSSLPVLTPSSSGSAYPPPSAPPVTSATEMNPSRNAFSTGESSPSATSTDSPSPSDADPGGPSRRREVPCLARGCKQKFSKEHRRDVHMLTHHSQTKSTFPCSYTGCPEVFSRKHDCMRHEVTQHGKPCKWVCDRCRRFFSGERTLAKHKCTGGHSDSRWVIPSGPSAPSSK